MPTLSAPRLLTFLVSIVLIGLAVASLYTRIPMVGRTVVVHRQWFFIGAYVLLALGVTTRSL
jgi:cadmium resistance protein CadD (predicted permease)